MKVSVRTTATDLIRALRIALLSKAEAVGTHSRGDDQETSARRHRNRSDDAE